MVEREASQSGTHRAAIRFEILSGAQAIPDVTFGSVGVGTSVEDARMTATQDWVFLFAEPYCAAQAAGPGGIRLGEFVAYASSLGLRGENPGGWLKDPGTRNQRILDAVRTELAPRAEGEVGVIDVKVAIRRDGQADGECRINGSLNTAACERIKALGWPQGEYMYKQVFAYKTAPP